MPTADFTSSNPTAALSSSSAAPIPLRTPSTLYLRIPEAGFSSARARAQTLPRLRGCGPSPNSALPWSSKNHGLILKQSGCSMTQARLYKHNPPPPLPPRRARPAIGTALSFSHGGSSPCRSPCQRSSRGGGATHVAPRDFPSPLRLSHRALERKSRPAPLGMAQSTFEDIGSSHLKDFTLRVQGFPIRSWRRTHS